MTCFVSMALSALCAAVPKPSIELVQLKFFEGQWKCEARVSPLEGADHAVKTRITAKLELEHFWLTLQTSEQKAANHQAPHDTNHFWGYDVGGQQFTRMGVGNQGDWETASSGGWAGDQWVWSGAINNYNGRRVLYRQTITKQGPREYTEMTEVNTNGDWQQTASSTCSR